MPRPRPSLGDPDFIARRCSVRISVGVGPQVLRVAAGKLDDRKINRDATRGRISGVARSAAPWSQSRRLFTGPAQAHPANRALLPMPEPPLAAYETHRAPCRSNLR